MFWKRRLNADELQRVVDHNLTQVQAITANMAQVLENLVRSQTMVVAEIRRSHDVAMAQVIRMSRLVVAQAEASKDLRTSQIVAGGSIAGMDMPDPVASPEPTTDDPEPVDEPPNEMPDIPDDELIGAGPGQTGEGLPEA